MRLFALILTVLAVSANFAVAEPVTFKDPTYKFEISYPADWTRKEVAPDENSMAGIEFAPPDDAATCSVYVNKLTGAKLAVVNAAVLLAGGDTSEMMFGEWSDADWKDVFDFLPDAKVLNRRNTRMKDGKLAVRAELTGTYDAKGQPVNMHVLAAVAYARKSIIANFCIVASIGSTDEDWQRHVHTLGEIVSSFDVQSD